MEGEHHYHYKFNCDSLKKKKYIYKIQVASIKLERRYIHFYT